MGDQVARAKLDLDLVLGLADFDPPTDPVARDRVAIAVQGHQGLYINDPLMQPIDFGDPGRERLQVQSLDCEQLPGDGADVLLVGSVDAIAPLASLPVEIVPVGKLPASKEVFLDEAEGSFYAGRTVRVADLVCLEVEAKALAEGDHLGDGDHIGARAAQHDDVRVVDHHGGRRSLVVTGRSGQEDLALETLEPRVVLEEEHPGVAERG